MSNTVLIKRSSTPNAVPGTANLALGELAINTYNGRLYTKVDTGTASVYELTQNQPIQVLGNVTGNSVNTGNGTSNLTLTLTTTGVAAGTYGGTTGAVSNIGVFTVDQYGRVTSASNLEISTSALANGTSNIQIANSGNISITVAGTPNVTVFANTGAYVTGLLSVTGNITGGNIATVGNVAAGGILTNNYYYANGSPVDFQQAAGANGQIQFNLGNDFAASANLAFDSANSVLTVTGASSVTGNITGGNIATAGLVTVTGNITGGNIATAGLVTTPNIRGTTGITVSTGSGDINLWPTSGNVHLNNTHINALASPLQSTDAATKQYVDDAVSAGLIIHTPVYVESPTALAATYAQGGTTHTVTDITGNTTLTFSSAHSLNVNDQIYWTSTFNGITANTSYFVYSVPANTQITLTGTYDGVLINNLTNGTGLSQVGRANPGVGATLTANVNGAAVIDGVTVTAGQRVLVYQQANGAHNGVYDVTNTGNVSAPWVFTRSSDMNTYAPSSINGVDTGDYFYVQAGDTGAGDSYVLTAPVGEIIIGYDPLTFTQFSASQVYSAGNGLTLSGTVFSVNVDNDTTAIVGGNVVVKASANLTTPNIGAATGTSLSVTGNITGANVISTGLLTVTGNIASGNISVSGNVTAAANVNANNATITANVVGGNIITAGLVSATGNVTGGNLVTPNTANVGTLVVNTFANILAATISVSNVTGALRVAGGVGVTGNVYADGVYVLGDAVLTVNSTIDGGTY